MTTAQLLQALKDISHEEKVPFDRIRVRIQANTDRPSKDIKAVRVLRLRRDLDCVVIIPED